MRFDSDLFKVQPTCVVSHAACGGNIDLSHNSPLHCLPADVFLSQN